MMTLTSKYDEVSDAGISNYSSAQLYLNILMAQCISIHKSSKYDDRIDAGE